MPAGAAGAAAELLLAPPVSRGRAVILAQGLGSSGVPAKGIFGIFDEPLGAEGMAVGGAGAAAEAVGMPEGAATAGVSATGGTRCW